MTDDTLWRSRFIFTESMATDYGLITNYLGTRTCVHHRQLGTAAPTGTCSDWPAGRQQPTRCNHIKSSRTRARARSTSYIYIYGAACR